MPFFGGGFFGGDFFGSTDTVGEAIVPQHRYVVLAQIDLDDASQYIATHRVNHPTFTYEARIVDVGRISRSIPCPSGAPITADCVIEIADTDRTWKTIMRSPVRRRVVTLKLIREGDSESAEVPLFVGEIIDFELKARSVRLMLADHAFAWLDEFIPSYGSRDLWPYMAQGTDEFFFPIIQGNCISLDSNVQGLIPLPHIGVTDVPDAFLGTVPMDRWALARHPVVSFVIYRQLPGEGAFTLVDASEYHYHLETRIIDGNPIGFTFVDFLTTQPDGTAIRADVYGIWIREPFGSMGGIAPDVPTESDTLRNPIDFFIFMTFSMSSKAGADSIFQTDHISTLRDLFETLNYKCDGAIVEAMTMRAFFGQYLSSFALDFFVNRNGKYDLAFTDAENTARELWSEHDLIIKDSWNEGLDDVANRLRYNFAKNYATNEFADQRIFDNIAEQLAQGGTYARVEEQQFDMHWIREAETAQEIALRRINFLSMGSFKQTFRMPIPIARVKSNMELANLVGVSHSYGIAEDIIGYVNREVKVIGNEIDLRDLSITAQTVLRVPVIVQGASPPTFTPDANADRLQVWYDTATGGRNRLHVILAGAVDDSNLTFTLPTVDALSPQIFINNLLQVRDVDYAQDGDIVTFLFTVPSAHAPDGPPDVVHAWFDDSGPTGPIRRCRESLMETVDGVLTTFTFPEPSEDFSEQIIRDHLTLVRDVDYTMNNATGVVTFNTVPFPAEEILLFYSVRSSSGTSRTNRGDLIGHVDNFNRIFRMPETFTADSERIYVNNLFQVRNADYRILYGIWIVFNYTPLLTT